MVLGPLDPVKHGEIGFFRLGHNSYGFAVADIQLGLQLIERRQIEFSETTLKYLCHEWKSVCSRVVQIVSPVHTRDNCTMSNYTFNWIWK